MHRTENPNAYAIPGEKSGVMQVEFFAEEGGQQPVLSFIHSYVGVTIHSNQPNWGAAPVAGPEHLKALRDGLIEACEHFGIE